MSDDRRYTNVAGLEMIDRTRHLELLATEARVADLETTIRRQEQSYRDGYIHGLAAYAWWKDGVEYVGTTGTTLKEAIAKVLTPVPRAPTDKEHER